MVFPTVTFNGATAVKWGTTDGQAVFLNYVQLWPPLRHGFIQTSDPSNTSSQEITVNSGETVALKRDLLHAGNWQDGNLAIFAVEPVTGNWLPVPDLHVRGTLTKGNVSLDGNMLQTYHQSGRHDLQFHTDWLPPGDYVIVGGAFDEYFKGTGVQVLVHVRPWVVPPDIVLQLPDNPFDASHTMQTIEVVEGQDLVLLFPKNPFLSANDSVTPGWRHIVMVGWDPGPPPVALDFLGTDAVKSETPPGNAYSYHFWNNGTKSSNLLDARGIDMYVPVTIRMHMTAAIKPGFWIMPVNGNFNSSEYVLERDALFYIKLVDAPKPIPAPNPVQPLAHFAPADEQLMINCGIYYRDNLDDYYYGSTGQQMPEINLKVGQDIQLPGDTGLYPFDVAAIFVVNGTSFAPAGHGDPSDSPSGDGALQSRYGGHWVMPGSTKVGDVLYVTIGTDASNPVARLAKINIVA
jgi:hypothetical protein